jgi:cytochrome c
MATLVSAQWRSGEAADEAPGLTRMKQSDCFNCHAVEQKIVGPQLVEIASKYRGQAGAEDAAVQRVLGGSTGVWGPLPMLPHPQHTVDELHMMVKWIFALKPGEGGTALVRGLKGEITAPADAMVTAGELEAVHTDTGRSPAPPIASRAVVRLRSRQFEAESMEFKGSMVLGFGKASGGKGLGSIGHQHTVKFPSIPLHQARQITARVASAGTGGHIEFHLNQPDGPLLANLEVKPTGDWDGWVEVTAPLTTSPVPGRSDVYAVFVKPGVGGGIMNLDWVRFGDGP